MFGYASDIERTDILYTSVLIQMWHGLAGAQVPAWSRSARAWRRSWLLGFATAVISRVRAAEHAAAAQATEPTAAAGSQDRARPGRPGSGASAARPSGPTRCTRTARVTYSGSGYRDGYAEGQRADIGASRVARGRGRALTGAAR